MSRVTIPLVSESTQRIRSDAAKDAYMKNVYFTQESGRLIINKRPRVFYTGNQANTFIAAGVFATKNDTGTQTLTLRWDGTDWDLYVLDGIGTATNQANVPSFAGDNSDFLVNWSEAGFNGTEYRVAFSLGSRAFVWNFGTATITQITDVDFLGATAGMVYLDDYLFASQGSDIRHSDNNDPFTWSALTTLVPQSMASTGINRIVLHKNHIAALGSKSIEFFWNAGNPVGNVLTARRDYTITNVGLLDRQQVTGISTNAGLPTYTDIDGGETGAFLSFSAGGSVGVHLLTNFQVIKISNALIDKYLNYRENESQDRHHSIHTILIEGRYHILLVIRSYINSTEVIKSFVYDLDRQLWAEWVVDSNIDSSGAFNVISTVPLYYSGATESKHPLGTAIQFINGQIFFLDNGFEGTPVYQDRDINSVLRDIVVSIQTPKIYGGNGEKNLDKYMTEFTIIGDRGASANNISVEVTDNDYQTYSTARTLDISNAENKLTQMGTFKERAFRLTHTANAPLRIEEAEAEVSL